MQVMKYDIWYKDEVIKVIKLIKDLLCKLTE